MKEGKKWETNKTLIDFWLSSHQVLGGKAGEDEMVLFEIVPFENFMHLNCNITVLLITIDNRKRCE